MAVLEFGGNVPAGHTQIEWTAAVPAGYTQIEWSRSVGTIDSRAPLEWIASAAGNSLAANAALSVEWAESVVRDMLAPAEGEGSMRVDRRIPIENTGGISLVTDTVALIEIIAVSRRDDSMPVEAARLLFRADAVANMEALSAAIDDLWIELEAGFLIPATLLTVERGRILATPGRLRILRVY
jgi:hypothetical protein